MYTMHMITAKLKPAQILEQALVPQDPIHTIRILTGSAMKDHVLYLSSSEDGTITLFQTRKGSSLTYREDLTTTLNLLLEILEYYRSWEQELADASRRGCTLTELLDLAYPMLTYPLIILDNHEWLVACSSALRNNTEDLNRDLSDMLHSRSSAAEKIAEFNQRFHQCFQRKDVYKIPGDIFTNNGYAYNLFHNERLSGILLIEFFHDPADNAKLDLFHLVGKLIQNMLNNPSSGLSIGDEETALQHYLRESTKEQEERLIHELRISSWQAKDPKQVLYISPSKNQSLSPNLNHALIMFNRLFALKAAEYQNGIVLLVNQKILSERNGDALILDRIGQLAYCAGASNVFTDISDLSVMVQRAMIALQKGDQSSGAVNYFEDHFLKYLFSMFRKEDAAVLQHPLLEKLRRYDKRYGSHLYHTLWIWLENERGIAKTAMELNIHRSTLIHRIERIEDLAQGVLESPENRLHILISYYLEQDNLV